MKLTSGILMFGMAVGSGVAQNPNIIDQTKAKLTNAEAGKVREENKALAGAPASAPSAPHSNIQSKTAAKGLGKQPPLPSAKQSQVAMQVAVEDKKTPDTKKDEKKPISFTGRRDPFVSPVVNRAAAGSGCSTGKRCLAIDQIALKGVVKADNGMIAVVVNAVDKAYFLRENDPVFNGYVVRITGDSVIFKETLQDKLGKTFVREITKKITTPAV